MTVTSRLYTLLGTSILRSSLSFTQVPPLRFCKLFPSSSISLCFHRYSSYAVTLDSESTIISANSIEPELSVNSNHQYHPWPEWVHFVDRLKTKGYLIESAAVTPPSTVVSEDGGGMDRAAYTEMGLLKDACLRFGRDRFDIFKSLSTEDIQAVVDKGCPNLFRKAVNSAKRLRAYLKLDEGDVCGACNLRGSCDKAYVLVNDSEGAARTVDIIRILLLYALDPLVISGGEKPPGRELIDLSARKLLSKMMELSETPPDPELSKPVVIASQKKKQSSDSVVDERSRNVEMKRGDWMCTKCNFMNFARHVRCFKCGEGGPKSVLGDDVEIKKGDWICSECNFINFSRNIRCLKCKAEGPNRVSVDDAEMKKGDWNCTQCDFMNFASNRKCLRCQEPRPKRQLNPGEWECPDCDFLNYRRNVVCKKCNHDRPKESGTRNFSLGMIFSCPEER
ncbi:zinc finger protein VAR3, chloroplastic isoform X1 [Olea europaea var. sylvestris]|uniref:zinc finger protein VAR3, chloroplastic isoform X1 n=1 Tax=Olea europaea var. sylvestris TaxID=158386 RepID=UPI000C1D3622|nr:zinc finger protein VAR3, chloroplastic isoform X1 [Olea europaea var. sylvestris]XP_022886278.1 zinc finger protein VAR3, chloroplastic isoform X1 [Olea europaea var. sylvestris]